MEHYYRLATQSYKPDELVYANGPGSFMGIKLAYVFLRTISIVDDVPLRAISGFELSTNGKIKANGSFCFVRDSSGQIKLQKDQAGGFCLPEIMPRADDDNLPFYFLPAVN